MSFEFRQNITGLAVCVIPEFLAPFPTLEEFCPTPLFEQI
jgi:hypothetical protein